MKEFAIAVYSVVLLICLAGVATCAITNDERSQIIWVLAALGWLVALLMTVSHEVSSND